MDEIFKSFMDESFKALSRDLFKVLLCLLGVGLTATIVYALCRMIVGLVAGTIIVGAGFLSYYLIYKGGMPWPLAILGCGIVAGLLWTPWLLVSSLNDLDKAVAKLPAGESPSLR